MHHRDANREVARLDRGARKPVALGPEHHRQPLDVPEPRVAQRERVVAKRERRRGEPARAEKPQAIRLALARRPRTEAAPGHLEDRAHAHAHRTPHERVAARGREQHRVDPERRGAAKGRTHVRGVRHALEDGHAPRLRKAREHVGRSPLGGPPHRTEHAARHVVAHEPRDLLVGQHVDRDLGHLLDGEVPRPPPHEAAGPRGLDLTDERRHRLNLSLLEKQRQRPEPRPNRHANDLLGLRDQHAGVRLEAASQLSVGQADVGVKPLVVRRVHVDDAHATTPP